eukprot:3110595-Amphidinium_carterae.1
MMRRKNGFECPLHPVQLPYTLDAKFRVTLKVVGRDCALKQRAIARYDTLPIPVTGWVVFSSDVAIFAAICLPELQERLCNRCKARR